MVVKVTKSDGTQEPYSHNKVLLCASCALGAAGHWDTMIAAALAYAVTTRVYERGEPIISSTHLLAMVGAALDETGFPDAAAALVDHHYRRELARRRTVTVEAELADLADADLDNAPGQQRWSKSAITHRLISLYGLSRPSARTAAAVVEERALGLGFTRIWSGLLRQIEIAEVAAVLRAQQLLEETDHCSETVTT